MKLRFTKVWHWSKGKGWRSGWRGLWGQQREFTILSDTHSALRKASGEVKVKVGEGHADHFHSTVPKVSVCDAQECGLQRKETLVMSGDNAEYCPGPSKSHSTLSQ